jgi:hypothetical protein
MPLGRRHGDTHVTLMRLAARGWTATPDGEGERWLWGVGVRWREGGEVAVGNECYHITMVTVERVQTGLRVERNTLKVLKGLAEYLDLSLGDLVEGIVLHAFEGQAPFGPPVLVKIEQLKAVYGLTLTAADAHKLKEQE